eukprot:465134_1
MSIIVMFLIRFSHPDDKNDAKLPRFVVVLSLYLACSTVLLLPFDVANQRQDGTAVDMPLVLKMLFVVIVCFLSFFIPFAFFFYESDVAAPEPGEDTACTDQLATTLKLTFVNTALWALVLGLSYTYLHYADITMWQLKHDTALIASSGSVAANQGINGCPSTITLPSGGSGHCTERTFDVTIQVTFPIYIGALVSFLGYFAFVLFAGVGVVALPMSMFN